MADRFIVIMAGGKGERFWPASRLKRPKQLLPIVGDKPMITQTIERLEGFIPFENVIILTNIEQLDGIREACPMLPSENVVAEPVGRDTAAAVGLSVMLVKLRSPNASMATLHSDAYIKDSAGFRDSLETAFQVAESQDGLVTVGISPTEPSTDYGYIHRGSEFGERNGEAFFKVEEFKEKPELETAKSYLASGDYYWNSGIFVWRLDIISAALDQFTPVLKKGLDEIEAEMKNGAALQPLLEKLYPGLEKIPVDVAIFEKAENVFTIPARFDWDDVGAWPAIARHTSGDSQDNVSKGDSIFVDSSGNISISSDDHLVAFIGVDDLIVVRSEDATLVCKKEDAQRIKELVKLLGSQKAYERLI